jgi:hypothetical protein
MQWIKTHLMIVIVGSVSVLSLTGLVLGYVLSSVGEELETDSRAMSSLQNVKPLNEVVVDVIRKQQQEDAQKLADFLQRYKDAKQYDPIEPKVFTETDHMARTEAAYRFQKACADKQRELLAKLRAQDMPTEAEFDRHVKNAIADKEEKQRKLMAGLGNAPPAGPTAPEPVAPGPRPVRGGGFGGMGGAAGFAGQSAADEETRTLRVGLALSRARSILCYAGVVNLDDRSDTIREGLTSNKSLDEMTQEIWYAQMTLWIEQDVLGAIARLNEKAAEGLSKQDQWVANMPFKRLVSFLMGNYVASAEGAATGGDMGMRSGGGAAGGMSDLLTAGPTATFTKRGSTPSVDVVRFRIQMVVEARNVLRVLDAISKAGFYTPVKVDAAEVVLQPTDYYIYGTAPIVDLTVVYEACFLRSSYEKWMPESIKLAVKEGRAGGLGKGAGVTVSTPTMQRGPNMPMRRPQGGRESTLDDESGARPRRRN